MKSIKRLGATLILCAVFALNAWAGDMPSGVVSSPQQPPAASAGEMPGVVLSSPAQPQATQQSSLAASTDMTESNASAANPIVEIVVSLLQSLLSIF